MRTTEMHFITRSHGMRVKRAADAPDSAQSGDLAQSGNPSGTWGQRAWRGAERGDGFQQEHGRFFKSF